MPSCVVFFIESKLNNTVLSQQSKETLLEYCDFTESIIQFAKLLKVSQLMLKYDNNGKLSLDSFNAICNALIQKEIILMWQSVIDDKFKDKSRVDISITKFHVIFYCNGERHVFSSGNVSQDLKYDLNLEVFNY